MNIKFTKKNSIILGIIIISFISLFIFLNRNNEGEINVNQETKVKNVSIITIGENGTKANSIDAVGSVKADTKVSVIAMQSATVRSINFNVGDTVKAGKRLVTLNDNNILTSLLNAKTDFANRENNLEIVKTSTDQDIKSAEISLANADKSLELSKIQLKTAQDNYDNGIIQIEKSKVDLKNNSVITYNNNLSTLYDALNQIDYILKVDGNEQIAGIEKVIAAKNKQSLSISKNSYIEAKNCYDDLLLTTPKPEMALKNTNESLACIQKTKIAIDDLITVLDNTITSVDFSEETLSANISKFNQLRLSVLGKESSTKSLAQAIENIEINAKSDKDKLDNLLATAKNQVSMAEIAYKNAKLGLEKTNSLKNQQILSAEIAKDSTQGQLNLALERASDLYINSPIDGIITKKSVEIGQEVSPGMTIAEVSQLNLMKIIIKLPSEEVYKVKIGSEVIIEDNLQGFVSQINPAADSLSKKVQIEIAFDNKNGELIAETFVNVKIPIESKIKSNKGFFLVPLKAVTITPNENYVYLVKDNIATKKDIVVGDIQNDLIEITDGLNPGDKLVIDGNKNLNNGEKIEIK